MREYWLIDPTEERMTFFRLTDGKFAPAQADAERSESAIIPEFQLGLAKVRATFRSVK